MYKKLCTEFYDLTKPEAPLEEVEFYAQHLRQASPPYLEAMCGSGRLLIPLLKRGFAIEGVDNSPDMLVSCKARCAAAGFSPILYEQSITELTIPKRYGAIIIPLGSFQLITDKATAKVILHRLHEQLLPGGFLLLDLFEPIINHEQLTQDVIRIAKSPEGFSITLHSTQTPHIAEQQYHAHNRYEKIVHGKVVETEIEDLSIRWYTNKQIQSLLTQAGFVSIQIYSDIFEDTSVRMYKAYRS